MVYASRLFFLAVLFGIPTSAIADERYFVLIFGSQRVPSNPNYAHTFAVFVRVNEEEDTCTVDHHVISWLPADGRVRVQRLFSEKGRLFELHETIRWVYKNGQRVSLWGPYEIRRMLYRRSVRQHKWLSTGFVRYKAADSLRLDFRVTNCIHAVATLTGLRRLRVASPSWGETASWFVTLRQLPWMINSRKTHDWLIEALDLDQYPIIYRDMRPPRSGLIWSRIKRRLGIPIDRVHERPGPVFASP